MNSLRPLYASPRLLEEVATYFKVLSEPVRLKLLTSICAEGPASIGELVKRLDMQQSAVSRHMNILQKAGFVQKKRQESKTLYYLPNRDICILCGMAADKISQRVNEYKEILPNNTNQ